MIRTVILVVMVRRIIKWNRSSEVWVKYAYFVAIFIFV
jgi:hypothetical protein